MEEWEREQASQPMASTHLSRAFQKAPIPLKGGKICRRERNKTFCNDGPGARG